MVHAGRVAPAAAPARSMQQTASSGGAVRLRGDAMAAPHPATASDRVSMLARTEDVQSPA